MASRYWVGGTGTWDSSTTHWSATSGGSSGASAPTSTDDVFFDGNSGTGTATISSSSTCQNIDFTGYTGTFSGNSPAAQLNIYGNVVIGSGATYVGNSVLYAYLRGTGSQTFTSNGKTLPWQLNFQAGTGTYTLQDALSLSGTSTNITLISGTLDTNNQAVSTNNTFNISGTTARTLTLGSSTITFGSFGTWNATTTTNLTFNVGTSTLAFGYYGSITSFGGLTYKNVTVTKSQNDQTIIPDLNCENFTFTGTSIQTYLQLSGTITCSGTFTATGATPATQAVFLYSNSKGTQRTISAASASLTNVTFSDINFTGAATWSGTGVGDGEGNTGLTPDTPRTLYWVHGASSSYNFFGDGRWSLTSGGTVGASDPLPQDTCNFDASSFTTTGLSVSIQNLSGSINGLVYSPKIDFTGVTNSPSLSFGIYNTYYIIHDLIFTSGMTVSGIPSSWTWAGRGAMSFASGGHTFSFSSGSTHAVMGTLTFLDDCNFGSTLFSQGGGTIDANDFNVTFGRFSMNASSTVYMGSGTWTLNASGSFWSAATGATVHAETSTIKSTFTGTITRTFGGGGNTYYNFWNANTSTSIVTITGSNTFNDIKIDAGKSVKFTAGTTTTVSSLTWTGTSGNLITIASSSNGSAFTISKASGTVNADYIDIRDSTATGGATFYAGANSVDSTGNSGWIFNSTSYSSGVVSATFSLPHARVQVARVYSRGLTDGSNDDDLSTLYTDDDYAAVAADDGSRVSVVDDTSGNIIAHFFKEPNPSGDTNVGFSVTWKGRSNMACSDSEIDMYIWNQVNGSYDFLTGDDTSPADTDITLSASVSVDFEQYYNADGVIEVIVIQFIP